MFFNPATLTAFQGWQLVLGATSVAPNAVMNDAVGTRTPLAGGAAINGPSSTGNAAKAAVLPELYALWSVTRDFKVGLSVNAPFGLTTEYGADFPGRYHALRSNLKTVDIGLNAAYRLNPTLSVGATVLTRHTTAELTNAVDYGQIAFLGLEQAGQPAAAAAFQPSAAGSPYDGKASVQGSNNVLGYKLGLVWEPCSAFRAGLAYQSSTTVKIKGSVHYDSPNVSGLPAPLQGAMASVIQGAKLVDGSVSTSVDLPDTLSLGLAWKVSPVFELAFEADRTGWSKFNQLNIQFGSGQSPNLTNENWKNTMFYSLGGTWKATQALTLRAGLALDQGAVDTAYRTPRIPDADRTWASLGLGYAFTKGFGMDLAYTHIWAKDGQVNLNAGIDPNGPDFFRGSLSGTYKMSIEIVALQARFTF
jgi:long-chain fatty acid transport protein